MEELDKIRGKELLNYLKTLQKNKTLIKVVLSDKNYEQLTVITHIRPRRRNPYFVIDFPRGYKEAASDTENLEMRFEFTGEDKLNYHFTTFGVEISRDGIRVKIPEFVNREQRREDFRIDVPPATELHVEADSGLLGFKVVDISLGGTLIVLVSPDGFPKKDTVFKVGQYFKDIELVFPLEGKDFRVHIEKATVVRLYEDTERSRKCCALQFINMEEAEKKTLTEFIYKYQRFLLRTK